MDAYLVNVHSQKECLRLDANSTQLRCELKMSYGTIVCEINCIWQLWGRWYGQSPIFIVD